MLGDDYYASLFVLVSPTARCPEIELTERELDALRYLGGEKEAACGAGNAMDVVPAKKVEKRSQLWPGRRPLRTTRDPMQTIKRPPALN